MRSDIGESALRSTMQGRPVL